MTVTTNPDRSTTIHIAARETLSEDPMRIADLVRQVAAERIAAQYLAEHGPAIFARLDPQAIANLAIAEGAAAVRETLAKKLPDVVHTHTVEYRRRGWF